jgi:hypothetical protein
LDRAVFPALRATPDGPAEGSACRQVASGLRQAIAAGFRELVTDGASYRVRRRGTFAVQEFAIKDFNPDRYSYRLQLRRVDPAGGQAGPR